MNKRSAVSFVLLLAFSCSQAVELPVEHSLDGGITFKKAGFIDGNFKVLTPPFCCTNVKVMVHAPKALQSNAALAPAVEGPDIHSRGAFSG
eukprot:1145918-Pelagomonas_calceolata.AAC.5